MKQPRDYNVVMMVDEVEVSTWSPGEPGSNTPPTQVHIILTEDSTGQSIVVRLKTKERVNWLIDALIEHREDVWPEVRQ